MSRKEKKKVKNKSKTGLIVWICIILLIIIIAGVFVGSFISGRLSNLSFVNLNKEELSVNEELYSSISDLLTKSEFKNVKKIVLFGIDSMCPEFEGDEGRSDSIIIAVLNPKYKKIKLISIPRDTYAQIPGIGKYKINHAYSNGKESLAIKTINENFGLDITEYVTIDFAGLIHIINELGGIELTISKQEQEFINLDSGLAYEISGRKKAKLSSYGVVTLDGEQALTHSRNRAVGDDFVRAERQRAILEAIFKKLSESEFSELTEKIDLFLGEVTTNVNIAKYIGTMFELLMNKDDYLNNISSVQVPKAEYATGEYIKGVYYFVPSDTNKMKKDMITEIYGE